jgi:hypothetical protein
MSKWSEDSVTNVVYQQIKPSIQVALDNQCWEAAVILIYAGIDAMAYLNMPADQIDVKRQDFVDWANGYISFPCKEQPTGLELYSGRCGMLHTYSTFSKLTREGGCRVIGYTDEMYPEVCYESEIDPTLVLVSIPALARAFYEGLDQFLPELFSDREKAPIAEQRFENIATAIPYGQLWKD